MSWSLEGRLCNIDSQVWSETCAIKLGIYTVEYDKSQYEAYMYCIILCDAGTWCELHAEVVFLGIWTKE